MDAHQLELIRKEFLHLDTIYFNTAYFGPSPYRAKHSVMRALQKELNPSFFEFENWVGIAERVRRELAQLLNCNPDNITHSTSTSDIINTIANGFKFEKGDVVCAIDKDYPSNILPWMHAHERGDIEFKKLSLDGQEVPTAQWLKDKLPKNTKIFNMSHVTFETGKRMNILEIGKLMKERDILFVVDATQSLGGIEIKKEELEYIDVLACSTYKWMLGPYGHGFAYFSQKAQNEVLNKNGNWLLSPSSANSQHLLNYTTKTLEGARKYDRGQNSTMLIMACLESGIEIINDISLPVIEKYNASLRDYFLENFPRDKYSLITPKSHISNIVALKNLQADSLGLERKLKFNNIDVSVREGNIRLSFHLFNTKDQIDKLIIALDS